MAKPADWITLHLKVTTPLFNGGADPDGEGGLRSDQEPGIRAASLRGAMRFWFRALAGTVAGGDLPLLAALERRVFGGAGVPSPVSLRITQQPNVRHDTAPDFMHGEGGQWIGYLLGQGLTEYDSGTRRMLLTRPYVPVGQDVAVRIGFTWGSGETIGALALAALWLCCTYGGIGTRVRRGFGGLRITDASEPLPPPWTKASLCRGGLTTYAGMRALWPTGALAKCRAILADLCNTELTHLRPGEVPGPPFDDGWDTPPLYPVLSQSWTAVGLSGKRFGDWETTLRHAGEQLRHFRADRPNNSPRARYRPKIETREWSEVVVQGDSRHFGVGALGLPVVYKDGYVVNADRGQGAHTELMRRASPLWLRAAGADDHWRLLSFAFLGEFLPGPNAPSVHLWYGRRQRHELRVAASDVSRLTRQWITELRADRSFDGEARRA